MGTATAARVDNYIRNGRIGRGLVRYLHGQGWPSSIDQYRFDAFRGDNGRAYVAAIYRGRRHEVLVGGLWGYIGTDLSDAEAAFFRSLNIGYK